MDVKNPTSNTVTYAFMPLTLGPGEVTTIDDSFLENIEYQKAAYNGTITIVKYEKSWVENKVVITVGVPPNEPSILQKGALVGAGSASIFNPFATINDLDLNNFILRYKSINEVEIIGVKSKKITVNGSLKIMTTPSIFNTQQDYTIDSGGNVTTDYVTPNSIMYAHINSNLILKLSVSEVCTNWKFVGWVFINNNSCIESALSVVSYENNEVRDLQTGSDFEPETNPEIFATRKILLFGRAGYSILGRVIAQGTGSLKLSLGSYELKTIVLADGNNLIDFNFEDFNNTDNISQESLEFFADGDDYTISSYDFIYYRK